MNLRTAIFTICSNNYLPQADVLFESLRKFHPDAALILGLADSHYPEDRYPDGVEVIPAERLGIPDFESFAFAYDVHGIQHGHQALPDVASLRARV